LITRMAFGALVLFAAGCLGKIDDGASDAGPPSKPVEVAASPFDAATVARARALCAEPHGDVDLYDNDRTLTLHLAGSWILCSSRALHDGPAPALPAIEFTTDGRYFHLVDDGRGGLVRGRGVGSEGTFHIRADYPGTTPSDPAAHNPKARFFLDINGWSALAFEVGPRRFVVRTYSEDWYVQVPLPPAT
jgi:hypothetical protein